MTRGRRAALAWLGVAATTLAATGSAFAHAVLESSAPPRGAQLERAPDRVSFRFSEAVEASFGAVRVYDAGGDPVDTGETFRPGDRGDSIAVGLDPGLPDGAYTATYRVISADAHPISGGFTFTVGDPGVAPSLSVADLVADAGGGAAADVALGVAKFGTYLATALLIGGLAFLAFVWIPAIAGAQVRGERWSVAAAAFDGRMARTLSLALIVGAIASIVGLIAQGMVGTGGDLGQSIRPTVIGNVLGTRFGTVWGLRLLDLGLIAALLALPRRTAPVRGALVAALAFLAVAPGLAGHPGVTDPRLVSFAASFAHVLAFSIWAGGLVALLAVVPAATRMLAGPDKTAMLAPLVSRFSVLALAAVAALLATGVIQSILQLEAWSELIDTGYGRAILVKAALLACLIGLGAVNRQRNRPRLERRVAGDMAPGSDGRSLRRSLIAEATLVAATLIATAVLTALSPATSSSSGPYSGSTELGPAELELIVDPARVGDNQAHLYLFDAQDGSQYDRVKELTVTAAQPQTGIGPLEQDPRKSGPGHYVIRGMQLTGSGTWQLHVVARVSAFDQYEATLHVPVG